MAEFSNATATLSTRPVSWWQMVWTILRSRIRSQLVYRTSFAGQLLDQCVLMVTEYMEVYVLLHHAPVFGGLTLVQATLVYGLAGFAFGLTDMVFGQLDATSSLIVSGRLETLMLRPTSVLLQLVTNDLQLKRLGRAGVGLALYLGALWWADIAWTPALVWLSVSAPLAGFLMYGSWFLASGCLLFWVVDGKQAGNSITYGGRYVSSVSGATLFLPLRAFFTFVVPATLIAYVPVAVMTGASLPSLIQPWMAWVGFPVAAVDWALVLLLWRTAIRRYTGAGG